MPNNITGSIKWEQFVEVPAINDPVTAQSVANGSEDLANRTQALSSSLTTFSGSTASEINALQADVLTNENNITALTGVIAQDVNNIKNLNNNVLQSPLDFITPVCWGYVEKDINNPGGFFDYRSMYSTETGFQTGASSGIATFQNDLISIDWGTQGITMLDTNYCILLTSRTSETILYSEKHDSRTLTGSLIRAKDLNGNNFNIGNSANTESSVPKFSFVVFGRKAT